MTISKTKNSRFRVRVKKGGIVVADRTFDTLREARAWEATMKALVGGGFDPRLGKSTTVETAADVWLKHREGQIAETTHGTDTRNIKALPVAIKRRPVGTISATEMQNYIAGLKVSAGTKTRVKITLSAFFTWSVAEGFRRDNPVKEVKLAGGPAEALRPVLWNQAELMAAQVSSSAYRRLMRVLAYTALRWGEGRAIRVKHVHIRPDGLRLHVQRSHPDEYSEKDVKDHEARFIPVLDTITDDVQQAMRGKGPDDYLFTTDNGAQVHNRNFRRDAWSKVAGGYKIKELRHGCITEWVANGVDLATVQQWAGHESLSTTQGYVHIAGIADQTAVSRLNKITSATKMAD